MTNIRFSLIPIKEKSDSDVINAGFKCFSEFDECDDLIPHFIICKNFSMWNHPCGVFHSHRKTLKGIFWEKMREYGVRSAIFTVVCLRRQYLTTKEEVKQEYRETHEAELKKDKKALIWRSFNEDLEYFYDSLQNPESKPKAEDSYSFLATKLTEEELRLVDEKNQDYLSKFVDHRYWPQIFNNVFDKIKTSSDPESKFSYSFCDRWTSVLHVTLKSIQEEMRKRAADEDLSHMESKKQRVNWYNRNQYTYKFVKKE